jgi:hypothetical protein
MCNTYNLASIMLITLTVDVPCQFLSLVSQAPTNVNMQHIQPIGAAGKGALRGRHTISLNSRPNSMPGCSGELLAGCYEPEVHSQTLLRKPTIACPD